MNSGYAERLARQLYQQGRYEEAEAAYRLAISAATEGQARLYLGLALCIDPEDRPDEALHNFRKAAKLDSMLADAHNGIGICEADLGRGEAAFRQALVIEPQSGEFHANLAICLVRQERLEDAEPCFRRAVSLDAQNLRLICDWCGVLLDLRRYRDAEASLKAALKIVGTRRDLLDKRAWWYYEERRYTECDQYLARLRGGPPHGDSAWVYFLFARTLKEQQKPAPAVDALRIAIALDPEQADFHDELGRVLEAVRKPDAAGAAYNRAQELSR